MTVSRRHLLRTLTASAAGAALWPGLSAAADQRTHLVILHTNDTHSRIDPFPDDGGRNAGLGGVARRSALINDIREEHEHVLLLDSGDIFQGTPYFNFFDGELEFKAMSKMEYDVATLGNHEFDNGVSGFMDVLPFADFAFISANYDVHGSPLEPHVIPYTSRTFDGLKVGLFGLGIAFDGLVLPSLHKGVTYQDPVGVAREMVQQLRGDGCDLIVCLSHLGYRYRSERPSDVRIAEQVEGIDLILGGHTHTFLDRPHVIPHKHAAATRIAQVGFAGIRLGRIDVIVDGRGRVQQWAHHHYRIDATAQAA